MVQFPWLRKGIRALFQGQEKGLATFQPDQPGSQTPFGNPLPGNSVSRALAAPAKRSFPRRRSQTEFGNEEANEEASGGFSTTQAFSCWLLAGLIVLGLGLRGYHYLRDPVIWHDEAALLLNVTGKSFAEQLGPLFFAEAAPPLFLWIEKALALTLGESTFALRLFPFLASCAAFLALIWAAGRVLPRRAVLLFALLLGCSDRLLWHCCEAKPYALDVAVAALLLVLFVWRRREQLPEPANEGARQVPGPCTSPRECLLYAALAPWLIFLSFPACFLLGGVALALWPGVGRCRQLRLVGSYALFLMLLGGSFLVLLLGPVRAQRNEHLQQEWLEFFPDWSQPWLVPADLAERLTDVGRYAAEPVGNALVLLAVVGAAGLWRRGHKQLLTLLLGPLVLACLAWLAGRYPLGATRVTIFAAPALLLLMAAGSHHVLVWLDWRHRYAGGLLLVVLLVPLVVAGYRVFRPWDRADTGTALALIREQRTVNETIIGTAWEHTWYFRDLAASYRPLVSRPHDPPFPPALDGQLDGLGRRCWLLQRGHPTDEEQQALAHFRDWTILERRQLMDVTVIHLERSRPLQSSNAMSGARGDRSWHALGRVTGWKASGRDFGRGVE